MSKLTTNSNKPPRTPDQINASRANGSKPLGPTTPQGKLRVSRNRMIHGFRSQFICLTKEDKSAYDDHLNAYLAVYTPANKVEADLIGLLASSMWQFMRYKSVEVALCDLEACNLDEEELRLDWLGMDAYGRLALALAFNR